MSEIQVEHPAKKATLIHQRAIFALLEENFETDDGVYADGWSDDRVAEMVGVTKAAVRYRREAAFGKLKHASKASLGDLQDAMDILIEKVVAMENWRDQVESVLSLEQMEKIQGLLDA